MRAAIFIDGGYIINQFKQRKITPDYSGLTDYLLAPLRKSVPLDLLRCYFYYCPPWMSQNPSEEQLQRKEVYDAFIEELKSYGRWSLRFGKLQMRREGDKQYFEQKRVDVLLSCDLVRHAAAGHVQHAILLAGDSDFIPAVEAAKESGVTLTLWCGEVKTVHRDLIEVADEVYHIDWKKIPQVRPKTKTQPEKESPPPQKPQTKTQPEKESPPPQKPQTKTQPEKESPPPQKPQTKTQPEKESPPPQKPQ
ncbi:MAG: NYN domain-containing protein, partial [Oligoflexales bacterium]|nr:NYN domain-containing protein [Oligoflexales bacterium]